MILTELLLNRKNVPFKGQRVSVKCDLCQKEYSSKLSNRNNNFINYSMDLCFGCKLKHQYKLGIRKESWTQQNIKNRGKTAEERFGEEKGSLYRKKFKIITGGKNNPKWSLKYHTKEEIENKRKNTANFIKLRFTDKTYDEIYGIEKSKHIRKKLSESRKGEKNPMYGKPPPHGTGGGWSGYYMNFYFRSLLELYYIHFLIQNNSKFISAEIKDFKIEYKDNGVNKTYHPDFYLIDNDIVIEIKPKSLINTKINILKFESARNKFKNFRILTEDDIEKLSYDELKDLKDKDIVKFDKLTNIRFNNYKKTIS